MKIRPTIAAPILLIIVFGFLAAGSAIPKETLGLDENPYLSVVIIQLVIFALPALFFCTLRGPEYRSRLRLRFPSPGAIVFIICAVVFMIAGSGIIEYWMCKFFPETMEATASAEYAGFAMNKGVFNGIYLILAFAFLPAVTEELLFRGVIITEYETGGVLCAVILSALTFSMSHFSYVRFPVYLFGGIVLAITAYAARSLIASIAVHFIYNIIVLFFEEYIIHVSAKQNISGIMLIFILTGVALIAGALMMFEASSLYRSYGERNVQATYIPKKKTKFISSLAEAIFSPPFLLLIILYIIITVVLKK